MSCTALLHTTPASEHALAARAERCRRCPRATAQTLRHLADGGKMLASLAGAVSLAELGVSLAEMIRQGKVDIISCTGANLEGRAPAPVG